MHRLLIAIVANFAVAGSSARGLCVYKGQMYAKTTLAEEFADSKWVVRAKVLSANTHWHDEGDPWTLYQVQVLTAFKGKPLFRMQVFTYRDSGGFYLDKGTKADIGGVYLLFLDPVLQKEDTVPDQARGATEVNYACGQSKVWGEVSPADRKRLASLAQIHR